MARHRRHRRHFRGLVSLPTVGGIKEYNPLGKTVHSTDVLIGAGIGLAGGLGLKYALNQTGLTSKLPDVVTSNLTAVCSALAGVLAYMFQRKGNQARATGHLVGALTAAAVPTVGVLLIKQFPALAGLVMIPNMGGLLVRDQMHGMLVRDVGGMAGLAAASAYGAGEDETVIAGA